MVRCHLAIDLLRFGGIGHTLAIHSNDSEVIMKFAIEKPAFRILVNTVSSLGAVGYTTSIPPSLTLGPGTIGGSIISENVTAKHLINVKYLAFETNPINKGEALTDLKISLKDNVTKINQSSSYLKDIEERLLARAGNPKVNPFTDNKPEQVSKGSEVYGEGMSKADIDKIVRDFKAKN